MLPQPFSERTYTSCCVCWVCRLKMSHQHFFNKFFTAQNLHPPPPKKSRKETKNAAESESRYGTDVAKCYGDGSAMLFLRQKSRKMVQTVKNYGGSKVLRIRAPYYLLQGYLEDCYFLELRGLDSSCPCFLSDTSIWAQ